MKKGTTMETKCILSFVAGGIVGAAAAYIFVDKKKEKEKQEEIQSVKDTYHRKELSLENRFKNNLEFEPEESTPEEPTMEKKEDKHEYEDITSIYTGDEKTDVVDYSKTSVKEEETEKGGEPVTKNSMEIIYSDEYEEEEDYDQIELVYYSDKVLVDDNDEKVNPNRIFGKSVEEILPVDEDSIHVRDNNRKIDYEITRDNMTYSEVTGDDYASDNEH